MNTVAEFVNALFALKSKGEYKLYEGPISGGGITSVTIHRKVAEGYSQKFYEIKQIIARPNEQARIQKIGLPSVEFAYQLIKDAIKERAENESRNLSNSTHRGLEDNQEYDSDYTDDSNERSNESEFIDVVEYNEEPRKRVNAIKVENTSANLSDENEFSELAEFIGGSSVKVANVPRNNNGKNSIGIRNSVLGQLDSAF